MQHFLERIQLILHKQIKLNCTTSEFIQNFRANVEEGDIGIFSSIFEAFSSSKNRYKGTISQNTFKLRRRRELFDRTTYLARVYGTFKQQNGRLVIDAEIKGFHGFLIPFYIFITLFYIILISMVIIGVAPDVFPIIFIFIHALLMYGIPYFIIRKRVKNTAIDLEKELFYMMRKE